MTMDGSPASPAVKLRNWLEKMAEPSQEPWSDWEDDDRDGTTSEFSIDQDRNCLFVDPTVGFRSRTDLEEKNGNRQIDYRPYDDGHAEGEETGRCSGDDATNCESGFTSSIDRAGI